MYFRGEHSVTLDSKGRISIPTRFRDALRASDEGKLVATICVGTQDERCLELYPLRQWSLIEEKLNALPTTSALGRKLMRLWVGNAFEVDMDANGRVMIPPKLRTYASLDKRLSLVGQGRKFELWSEDLWAENQKILLSDDDLMDFEGLGI